MKPFSLKPALCITLATMLAACGGGGGGSTGGGGTPTPPPSNGAPTIDSTTTFAFDENDASFFFTVSVSDPDGDALTVVLESTGDGQFFDVDSAGAIFPTQSFDFENPQDANRDNIYVQNFTVSDGTNTTNGAIEVTIRNVDEAPTCSAGDRITFNENTTGNIYTFNGQDPEGVAGTYELTRVQTNDFAGLNQSYIDAVNLDTTTGIVSIGTALDFESENPDFIYDVEVRADYTVGDDKVACTVLINLLDLPGVLQSGIQFTSLTMDEGGAFEQDQDIQFAGNIDGDNSADLWLKSTAFNDGGYDQPNGHLIWGAGLAADLLSDGAADIAVNDLSALPNVRIFGNFVDPGDGSQGGGEEFNVEPTGDIDGDGIPELLVLSRPTPASQTDSITSTVPLGYILWGDNLTTAGLTEIDVTTLTPAQGLTIVSPTYPFEETEVFRRGLIGTAGNLDGDARADIVISLPEYSDINNSRTRTYIIPGSALNAAKAAGTINPEPNDAVVTLAEFGSNSFDDGAVSLSVLPDLTGDGADELVIANAENRTGVIYSEDIAAMSRTAEVFYSTLNEFAGPRRVDYTGRTSGTNQILADVDGDGESDLIVATDSGTFISYGIDITDPMRPNTFAASISLPFGSDGVAALGDIDGDGLDDIAFGSPGPVPRAYVITGEKLMSLAGATGENFDPTTLTTGEGIILNALPSKVSILFEMAAIPDIDGDGLSELSLQFIGSSDGPIETNIVLGKDLLAGLSDANATVNLPDLFDLEVAQ